MYVNDLIEFKMPTVNIIKLKDEYDVNEMKEKLQSLNRVLSNGLLPGFQEKQQEQKIAAINSNSSHLIINYAKN